jgi:hydroxymethylbilane synthase
MPELQSAKTRPLKLGTRGSPLALAQAEMVRAALGALGRAVGVVPIRTTGDRITDRPLAEAGGKGLFTKEIDAALLSGAIDFAVHSAKDLPTALPEGIVIAACLPRADYRDAFLSPRAETLLALPHGAVIGTASLRRAALALRLRPDLKIVAMRGNVETRLRKLEAGEADATMLAMAGLTRLGLAGRATSILDADDWLPAPGQGTVAITARSEDVAALDLIARIDHAATSAALACERAFLGGSTAPAARHRRSGRGGRRADPFPRHHRQAGREHRPRGGARGRDRRLREPRCGGRQRTRPPRRAGFLRWLSHAPAGDATRARCDRHRAGARGIGT